MQNPNRRLLQILGIGWLAFMGVGFGLRQALSGPSVTVVIDRSYCPPNRWQQLAETYNTLYEQDQQRRINIDQVIYISDLDATVVNEIPSPEEFATLSHFGQFNQSKLQEVTTEFPDAKVLSCQ
jgi:hypothetical protein